MRKTLKRFLATSTLVALGAVSAPFSGQGLLSSMGVSSGIALAASASSSETILVSLDVLGTLALSCEDTVVMTAITGTGKSSITLAGSSATNNVAMCNVKTNNSTGYKLEWNSSSAMSASGAMQHVLPTVTSDVIPMVGLTTPSAWSVSSTTSGWGAKLGASSEGYGTGTGGGDYTYPGSGWGTDDSYASGNYMDVDVTSSQFMQKISETDADGEYQYLVFGAEVGSSYLQPTGTYQQEVTVTATTL